MLRPATWVLGALAIAPPAIAQSPAVAVPVPLTRIASAPSCSTCRLSIRTIARLGGDSGLTFHELAYGGALDRRGRLFVTGIGEPSTVTVHDTRTGVTRRIGRPGQGPGEFVSPAIVLAGAGDSVYVWDETMRRLSVLSPELVYVRSVVLRDFEALRGSVLGGGRIVFAGRPSSPSGIGFPLLELDPRSGARAQFGGHGGVVRPEQWFNQALQIGPARDGGLWTGRVNRYLLTHWDPDHRATRQIERQVSWFPAGDRRDIRRELPFSQPGLVGVWQDAKGLIWTVSVVPVPRMAAVTNAATRGPTADDLSHEAMVRRLDSMIEVLDPARGTVLVSQRVSGPLVPAANGGLLRLAVDRDGLETLELLQISLAGR
ncbi:MAG: hypothetical protein ACRENB_17050 [Gemmatimonadales bacterium]